MSPNAKYSGPHTKNQSKLSAVPFTSDTAEWNAIKSGNLDQGYVPFADLPQVDTIKSNYNVFGYPGFGFNYVTFNFKDKTGDFNNIVAQLYFRQAMAHLEDEAGYIKAFYHGAGGQAFGPVPALPPSTYTPNSATHNPNPFSISAAKQLLTSHGWTINPGGTSVCAKAGSGAGQCGAGIPAGTKLAFNLVYNTSPATIGQQITDLVSKAKQIGINITLKSDNFNHMIATYYNVAAPQNVDKWAMEDFGGFSIATYPTMNGIFNCAGTYNIGSYCDKKADAADRRIHRRQRPVRSEGGGGLPHHAGAEPLPAAERQHRRVEEDASRVTPAAFESLTQFQLSPEFWYFTTSSAFVRGLTRNAGHSLFSCGSRGTGSAGAMSALVSLSACKGARRGDA